MKKSHGLWLAVLAFGVLGAACAEAPEIDGPEGAVLTSEVSDEATDEDGYVLESTSEALAAGEDFCWKDSYGRGAGSVPDACPGQQEDAGLCYNYCAPGYYGVGPVCWQGCPSGFRDDGTACWLDSSIISANNSQCPWWDTCGLTTNRGCSTCPAGYRNDGCTCRRDAQMFYKGSYGRGAGAPRSCRTGLQYDAGLCYPACEGGFSGVGPVCWGQCPADAPVQCGAGCATSDVACADQVISQVEASLEMAGNIASAIMTAGTATAAKYSAKVAMSAAAKQSFKDRVKKELRERAEDVADYALDTAASAAQKAAEGEQVDWTVLDPTGIAELVDAFNAPRCTDRNLSRGKPTSQSSTAYGGDSSRAVDGNTDGNWGANSTTHTNNETNAWWQVNLQSTSIINQVVIWNRTDCCSERLSNFLVEVRNFNHQQVMRKNVTVAAGQKTVVDFGGVLGQHVVVQLYGTNPLSLAEVQVMGN